MPRTRIPANILLNQIRHAYPGRTGSQASKVGAEGPYVYDAQGQLAAEYSTQVASASGTSYPFTDVLGSVRAVTNSTGTMVECYDYLPFGRLLVDKQRNTGCYMPATSRLPQKFTGKERDAESGLDFFETRYMSAAQGRFTSPDSIANDWELANPQTWNRYTYARNNPLVYVDPHGASVELIGETEEERKRALAILQNSLRNKDAASRLYINSLTEGKTTRYFVGIRPCGECCGDGAGHCVL